MAFALACIGKCLPDACVRPYSSFVAYHMRLKNLYRISSHGTGFEGGTAHPCVRPCSSLAALHGCISPPCRALPEPPLDSIGVLLALQVISTCGEDQGRSPQ